MSTIAADRRKLFADSGLEAAASSGTLRSVEQWRSKLKVYTSPPFSGSGYSVILVHFDGTLKRAVTHHLEPALGNPSPATRLDPKMLRVDHVE